jgi:hypothetical protein
MDLSLPSAGPWSALMGRKVPQLGTGWWWCATQREERWEWPLGPGRPTAGGWRRVDERHVGWE